MLFVVVLVSLCGCAPSAPSQNDNPAWVNQLIARFEREPVGNPPQSIYRYEYKGKIVYYVPQQCCDQFSTLYDEQGQVICAPDGGITGKGDGKCPDFRGEAKNERLIWRDSRTTK